LFFLESTSQWLPDGSFWLKADDRTLAEMDEGLRADTGLISG
jgi:hypothetical protein